MITIPTLKQLKDSIVLDIETQYGTQLSSVGKVFLQIFASVHAAKLKLIYLSLAFIQKQLFADTADTEAQGGTLERIGRIKLGRNPFPASPGVYAVTISGLVGAVIKAGTTFKSNDDSLHPGVLYVLDNDFTFTGTAGATVSATITVRSLTIGTSGKLSQFNQMTVTSPVANVDNIATVATETTTPVDAETTEQYRQAIILSYRLEPTGGSASDYRLWALDVSGVNKVYPFAKSGATGEINVFVEATTASSTDGKGTPSASMINAVDAAFTQSSDPLLSANERGRKPLGVYATNVLPVTPLTVIVTVTGYQNLDIVIQTLLTNAIQSTVSGIRPFVAASDALSDKNDILDNNRIISTILNQTPGAVFTSVSIDVNGTIVPTYTFSNGEIPFLSSVVFN